jgi:hypothetical protein
MDVQGNAEMLLEENLLKLKVCYKFPPFQNY